MTKPDLYYLAPVIGARTLTLGYICHIDLHNETVSVMTRDYYGAWEHVIDSERLNDWHLLSADGMAFLDEYYTLTIAQKYEEYGHAKTQKGFYYGIGQRIEIMRFNRDTVRLMALDLAAGLLRNNFPRKVVWNG